MCEGRASWGMFFLVQKTAVVSDQNQITRLCRLWSDSSLLWQRNKHQPQRTPVHQLPCWSLEEKKEKTPWEKSDEVDYFRTSRNARPLVPFWALAVDEIRIEISLLIWRDAVLVWTLAEMKQSCMWFTLLHMKFKEASGWVGLWGKKTPKQLQWKSTWGNWKVNRKLIKWLES